MFGSDNQAPAHPLVLEAVVKANSGRAGSYGDDAWSARALRAVQDVFESDDLDLYVVGTGSAANGLALSMLCPPWGAVLALAEAHVIADEGSGPEHFTSGARMIGIGDSHSKLMPQDLEIAAKRFAKTNVQAPQPRAITISNLSENGLAYTPDHLAALGAVCAREGWGFHMDGARFANALVGGNHSAADISWRAGVNALSLGLTKNGALFAEGLIIFGKSRSGAGAYLRKRAGHLFSKQRYMSAQIAAMLEDGLWLNLASQANAMATRLATTFSDAGATLVHAVDGNEVFVVLSDAQAHALKQANIGFYPWAPAGEGCYRFVTCWQTSAADIAAVASALVAAS
jgi:threonine aldolase